MKGLQVPLKHVCEKFHLHEIAAVNSSELFCLENAKKTYNQTTAI